MVDTHITKTIKEGMEKKKLDEKPVRNNQVLEILIVVMIVFICAGTIYVCRSFDKSQAKKGKKKKRVKKSQTFKED